MATMKVRKKTHNKKRPHKKKHHKKKKRGHLVKTPHRNKLRIVPVNRTHRKGYVAQYSPQEVTHTELTFPWEEVPRAVGKPMLVRGGGKLHKMSMQLTLGHTDYRDSHVQPALNHLRKLARSKRPLKVAYGEMESKLWRMTNMSVTSQLRARNGQISRATVDLEFTAIPKQRLFLGPASGGKGGKSKKGGRGGKKKKHKGGKGRRDRPKFYVIKKKDTMVKIAIRFYGKASMWRRIADVNDIKKPGDPKVGKRIRLP
jgi:nucleoid-associated protein YgaU